MRSAKVIYNILANNAGVSALVGNRISPLVLPQGSAFPAIVYSEININPNFTKDANSRLDQTRVQIDCLALTYEDASELADAVRDALNVVTPGEYNGVNVFYIQFDNQQEFFDDAADYGGVMQVSQDYLLTISYTYGLPAVNYLLLEDGGFLLQEDGFKIVL
jgi:hypothetical protein